MERTLEEVQEHYKMANALFDAGADNVVPEFTRGEMSGIRQTLGWLLGDNCADPLWVILVPDEIWASVGLQRPSVR